MLIILKLHQQEMAAKHQHSGLSGSSHDCCSHQSAVLSINQTMDEMEFERGIWSAALNGEEDRLEKFLNGGTDPNARDSTGYAPLVISPSFNKST